jgi:hypothetical protein
MSPRPTSYRARRAIVALSLIVTGCASAPPSASPAVGLAAAPSIDVATPTSEPTTTPSPTTTAMASAPSPPSPFVDPTVADLTGVTTDPARAHRLPLAVLLDDNRVARPQSGFNRASIVYQAPADGGETRYMLVFQENDAPQIGPVRSARYYFLDWATEIRAAIGHYGGERRSRAHLTAFDGVRFTDIDALGSGAKAYHRVASRTAPHNGYTSTTALWAMAAKLGGPAIAPVDTYRRPFVAPMAIAGLPASQRIGLRYQTGAVEYRFDRATDVYRRLLDGKPQIDPADKAPVTTRNVVVLFMPFHTDTKVEPGHSRPIVDAIGTGRALIFREGRAVEGTWSKTDQMAPTRLLDAAGNEIPLVTGRTFFQVVKVGTTVDVGP